MTNDQSRTVTAAMLAIGDELLSGRTRDKNIGHLATALTLQGINLKEVRIVADEQADIVLALNELRKNYQYVFTSGGIGPTHDDITADAVAVAFATSIDHDPRAMAILEPHYQEIGLEFTTARMRMARIPEGASLIENKISKAPGFKLENVYVMAGVPAVFQTMLEEVLPTLEGGAKMLSHSIDCEFGEGTIGDKLGEIQAAHPEASIGSYPRFDGQKYSTQIVVRSTDTLIIDAAVREIHDFLGTLG
ncbi:MAG: molybdopterin-binding protein [Pseudomonadota bacterium]